MGVEQTVTFPPGAVVRWSEVSDLLARREFPAQVRMIDGELALPDEVPPDSWGELRVGTTPGMVTLKRVKDQVVLVTWGNAGPELVQARNALAWALAEAAGGRIVCPDGPQEPARFRRSADFPPVFKDSGS